MFEGLDSRRITFFQIKSVIVSGIGIFSDSYNLYAISLVYYLVSASLHLSPIQDSLMTSASFIGAAVGAFMFGFIADRIGRKPMYGIDLAFIAVGSFLQFFTTNFYELVIFRSILGFGIGGDYVLSPVIMAENADTRDRGKLMIMTFPIMAAFGAMLVAFVDQISIMYLPSSAVWHLVLAFGGVPALLVIYLRRKIPETPRFEARVKGNSRELTRIESEIGSSVNVDIDSRPFVSRLRASILLIFVSAILWILYDMYSTTFAIYGPITIAYNLGLTPITFTYYAEIFAGIPGAIVSALLIDRVGRRKLIVVGYAGVFFWLLMYSLLLARASIFAGLASDVTPAGLIGKAAILGFFFYIMNYLFSATGPASIIGGAMVTPEITPTKVRGTSQGITVGIDRTADAIGLTAFPILLSRYGLSAMVLAYAMIAVLSIIMIFLIPEAAGRTLEEVSKDYDTITQ
ncbi:MFS transporter [Thermoplasma sp.]|uniref:MFS transporter n=1 Tax=Thermoplasma sp. TaxID=1973142 RepID=UPI0012786ECE|nr:MFS transporter [Thermoplasma sp.]KAA8922053.1 MAG: MFS transporter [Thermoplasma sp.]